MRDFLVILNCFFALHFSHSAVLTIISLIPVNYKHITIKLKSSLRKPKNTRNRVLFLVVDGDGEAVT